MKLFAFLVVGLTVSHAVAEMAELNPKPSGEMMKSTVKTCYEMFKSKQMEDLMSMMPSDVHWDSTALRGFTGGYFIGKEEIRTLLYNMISAIEFTKFDYEFVEADEGRATVLTRVRMEGKVLNTQKPFTFNENHLWSFVNGQMKKIKLWGDERELVEAQTNKIMALERRMESAFFSGDEQTLRTLTGNVKVQVAGDPKEMPCEKCAGYLTVDEWMAYMKNMDMMFLGMKILHASDHYLMTEWTLGMFRYGPNGAILMGHKPEEFRMYHMLSCDDDGKLTAWETHTTPAPAPFLFMMPSGGSSHPLK